MGPDDITGNNKREWSQRIDRFQRMDSGNERFLQDGKRVGEKYSLLRHTYLLMGRAGFLQALSGGASFLIRSSAAWEVGN